MPKLKKKNTQINKTNKHHTFELQFYNCWSYPIKYFGVESLIRLGVLSKTTHVL